MDNDQKVFYNSPQNFSKYRMHDTLNGFYWHSFSKIESMMWFYFVATKYIDMGYKSIHMGIYYHYANKYTIDPGYEKLYLLCTKIREYAQSENTFVLLTAETGLESSPKLKNSDYLVFDFDSRAMRPHEIESINSGDFGCVGIVEIENTVFDQEPCDMENYPAVIDPCVISQFGQSVGGISPLGCHFSKVPYYIHWDFGTGVLGELGQDDCFEIDPMVGQPSLELTYGYEDTRWFGLLLSSDCKASWIESMYCQFRNEFGSDGFLQIPLLIPMKFPEQYEYINCNIPAMEPNADGAYIMSDDQNVLSSIIEFMDPGDVQISYYENCNYDTCVLTCNGALAPLSFYFLRGTNEYVFSVVGKNCTSTYSWHIFDETHSVWVTQALGNEFVFRPPHDGRFRIILREDNLGIEPYLETFGTRQDTLWINCVQYCCQQLTFPGHRHCIEPYFKDDELSTRSAGDLYSNNIVNTEVTEIIFFDQLGRNISLSGDDILKYKSFDFKSIHITPGMYFVMYFNKGNLLHSDKILILER